MTDSALEEVIASLVSADPDGVRMATTLRNTLDQLYDGQRTGRYRWDQLFKTEKTHCGTLVEINLQREFLFDDGLALDYSIAGEEVDCKYSQHLGGWMIPNEALGHLCLVVNANDAESHWSAGVVRITSQVLRPGRNRDAKATLSLHGRESIRWLRFKAQLPPNVLLSLEDAALDRIFSHRSGQQRLNELFRQVTCRRIGRGVVATVAQQDDYMKRVRSNGGSRTWLRPEGIVIFGHYANHRHLAIQLGLDPPLHGESVSARLAPSSAANEWSACIDGRWWRLAYDDDPVVEAPMLPSVSEVS